MAAVVPGGPPWRAGEDTGGGGEGDRGREWGQTEGLRNEGGHYLQHVRLQHLYRVRPLNTEIIIMIHADSCHLHIKTG